MTQFYRNLKAAADNKEEFPAWNPKEIEGWDKMTKDEQNEVKQFYDSLKELYDALDALDKELDKLDSPKDKPAVNKGGDNKGTGKTNDKARKLDRAYPTGTAQGRPQASTSAKRPNQAEIDRRYKDLLNPPLTQPTPPPAPVTTRKPTVSGPVQQPRTAPVPAGATSGAAVKT